MEEIKLDRETVQALATEIMRRLLQVSEKIITEESHPLGIILGDTLRKITEERRKKEKEKEFRERVKDLPGRDIFRPLHVTNIPGKTIHPSIGDDKP